MTTLRRILPACIAILFPHKAHASDQPVDMDRLIEAIRQVENTPTWVIGKAGERSQWQIMPEVWEQHSTMPFFTASTGWKENVAEQRRVAIAHIAWLMSRLERPTVYRLALCWNAGLNAVETGRVGPKKTGYARRVVNIYEDLARPTST